MIPKGDPYSLARAYEGRTFGGYRIARAIATGGMATVFLARRTGPGRFAQTAALKVIHPHLAKEREFVEMFLEEARIASSINHPNVCRVLDFGQAEGTYYLAMEYVRGETWATALERLTAQRESRVRMHALSTYVIGAGLRGPARGARCAWIRAAFRCRSCTGTSRPQNLFIAYDGSVRVLDFGIASTSRRDAPGFHHPGDQGSLRVHGARAGTRYRCRSACGHLVARRVLARSLERRASVRA